MRRNTFAILLGISLLAWALPAFAATVEVKFVNESAWTIYHVYMQSTDTDEWGPDQLGDEVIGTGESFTIQKIPVGKYDLKLVDEDGDECVVANVKVAASEDVSITDQDLLGCQAATEAADDEEEE